MKEANIIKYFSQKTTKSVYLSTNVNNRFLFQKEEYIVVKKIDIQKIILSKIESSLLEIDNIFGNISDYNFYKSAQKKIRSYIKLEIDILDNLTLHNNFVKYLSYELLENFFILRMEYCTDKSVADYINSNVYDGRFIKNFITDMKNGLDFLKEKHIIHRDLKLNNILLKNNIFKITDFELACYDIFFKDVSKSNDIFVKKYYKICGTLRYISPELISSIGKDVKWTHFYSFSTDVWSIGCCVYQLVYSKNLFPDVHSVIDIDKLFKTDLTTYINDNLKGGNIVKILKKMLNIDKENRLIDDFTQLEDTFLFNEFKVYSLNSWEIIESASIENLKKEFNNWLNEKK